VPAAQVPFPSHLGAGVKVAPSVLQEAEPHSWPEPTFRQAPLPSHVPSLPHGFAGVAAVSSTQASWGSVPAATGAHVPSTPPVLAAEQALQPLHAWSQQTPSTQNVLGHWSLPVHGEPVPGPASAGGAPPAPPVPIGASTLPPPPPVPDAPEAPPLPPAPVPAVSKLPPLPRPTPPVPSVRPPVPPVVTPRGPSSAMSTGPSVGSVPPGVQVPWGCCGRRTQA
jgi:hypothetical protein